MITGLQLGMAIHLILWLQGYSWPRPYIYDHDYRVIVGQGHTSVIMIGQSHTSKIMITGLLLGKAIYLRSWLHGYSWAWQYILYYDYRVIVGQGHTSMVMISGLVLGKALYLRSGLQGYSWARQYILSYDYRVTIGLGHTSKIMITGLQLGSFTLYCSFFFFLWQC